MQRLGNSPRPIRNKQLLDHFIGQLRDEFLYTQHPSAGQQAIVNETISHRIQQLLNDADGDAGLQTSEASQKRWDRAYEIERLLAYLKASDVLAIELLERMEEAARVGLPIAARFKAEIDALSSQLVGARAALSNASKTLATSLPEERDRNRALQEQAAMDFSSEEQKVDSRRRAILAVVLGHIQWQQQKTAVVRSALWESATNLLGFGLVTMFVVAFPFVCFIFESWTPWKPFSTLLRMFPNYGLYTAMSFGLMGAFFSRLTSLKFTSDLTLEEAENRYSFSSLWIRGAVGMGGALLFYFFMRSQIISGIAPDFENFAYQVKNVQTVLTNAPVLLPSKDWALLVLFSFAAGFSEKLVPDSLSRVEAQVSAKK